MNQDPPIVPLRERMSRWKQFAIAFGGLLIGSICCVILGSLVGCSTVAPKVVKDRQASFDGNTQNSGLIEILANGNAVVTAHWRDRYNAFIDRYGASYQIKMHDFGLTQYGADTWQATKQARSYFAIWNLQSKR